MKKALALVLALVLAMSMVACGGASSSAPAASSGSTAESTPADSTPAAAGTSMTNGLYPGTMDADMVTININTEPPEMNSITTTDATAISIMRDVLEGLTSLDENNQPIPGVAESWDVSANADGVEGTVYTFHLRDNAVWSNGDPVTANDFVFALTQHFTAETGAAYAGTWASYVQGASELLAGTGSPEDLGVKAIDDTTLEITLTNPCAYFLSMCAFPSFYPMNEKFYNEMGGVDGYALDADKMLYNGPYVISEWQHEDHVTITKNDNYWDKENKAFIPTVKMVMISDSGAALNSFQGGELDMVGLSGDQVQLLKGEGCTPGQYPDAAPGYLEYNTVSASTPALSNAKVRRALTMAIDAESLNRDVLKNSYLAATGMVPDAINGGAYSEARGNLIDRSISADDVKALFEEGCAEAGVDPASINLNYVTDEGDNAYKTAAFIQNQWKEKLGIEATVTQMPFKSCLQAQTDKTYDVCFALWGPDYDDPLTYLDMFVTDSGNNHTGWSNAEFDELIASSYTEADAAKREEIMINAEKLLMEEMPIGPIYHRIRDYITSDKLTGVVRTAFQDIVMHYATIVG